MKRTAQKPKQPKALWYRAKHGDKAPKKVQNRIRPIANRKVSRIKEYNARVKEWKRGKTCACSIIYVLNAFGGFGSFICSPITHPCQDNHHGRGKLGPLLMDERFWIPVCRKAHAWIGDHPEQARELGLLCAKGEWNTMPKGKK